MLYDKKWNEVKAAPKLEPWRQVLLDAADLIRKDGWIVGSRHSERGYCAVGAISQAAGWWRFGLRTRAENRLRRYLGHSIMFWNDALCSGKSKVIETLETVAKS